MNGGKPFRSSSGYTIVELMIVLAVSGVLFLIAANFISGKQEKTSFQQGSNQVATDIQSVIEDVTDGHFTDIPITCSTGPPNLNVDGSGSATQGTNQGCVFLGKLLYFNPANIASNYQVFTLAGARNATTLSSSQLTAVYNPAAVTPVNLTKTVSLPNGLSIWEVRVYTTAGTIYNGIVSTALGLPVAANIVFMQGLGTVDTVSGAYQSGAQNISMFYLSNLPGNLSEPNAVTRINAAVGSSSLVAAQSINICITDGQRYASIILGNAIASLNNGNQFHVKVQQDGEMKVCP